MLAAGLLAAAAAAAADESLCLLRPVDDAGRAIDHPLTLCRAAGEEPACRDLLPGGDARVELRRLYAVEGERHGPVTASPEPVPGEEGTCTLTVPRKARLEISLEGSGVTAVDASFFDAGDERMVRPLERVTVAGEAAVYLPPGAYVVALAARGWAPDLRLLEAEPGSRHRLRYRRLDGWSAVLRLVADAGGGTVEGARVELFGVGASGEPSPAAASPGGRRPIAAGRSDRHGLVVVSGLDPPLAAVAASHPRFVATRLPSITAAAGTFELFEVRLPAGGGFEVLVTVEGVPAAGARCELLAPDLEEPVLERRADGLGVCYASVVPPGGYALRLRAAEGPARGVEPLEVTAGTITQLAVDLRPITVRGHVVRGDEPAADCRVVAVPAAAAGDETVADCDDDGAYELVLWRAGEYLLLAGTEEAAGDAYRSVAIEHDEEIDFQLAANELAGRVVDEAGSALPSARVLVRWLNTVRAVELDEAGWFRVPLREASGMAEIRARADGFEEDEQRLWIEPGRALQPLTLVLRRRQQIEGEVTLPSGLPAAGVWLWIQQQSASPVAPRLALVYSDRDGRFRAPAAGGPLRVFYGGPGCPLAVRDVVAPAAGEALHLHCSPPANLLLKLQTAEGDEGEHVQVLLRRSGVIIPPDVLVLHLRTLGLPPLATGGLFALAALEPDVYDLFHGNRTSVSNLAAGNEDAYLTSVSLGPDQTVELELRVAGR
ncbi:MAG: carboxypeptidase regulatory-like domain-containing protein [Acidobacteria bacterium]|nr:MAG: carboxypeptidase regulatory-like domain-containing protein [Acidobacteriota bacterium]